MGCAFIWLLISLDLGLLIKERLIFSKVVNISDVRILSGWVQKYKPALSKLDSSWHNSYCARLVIVSLAVNAGVLQSLVNEDNFACWVYNNFWSDLLLCDIIDFLMMKKSIVETYLDKKFSEILSSFKTCWSSLLHFLMVLQRSFLRTDEASLFQTFDSLKIKNFGYKPSCLKLLRKSVSNFSSFFLYFSFSYLWKSKSLQTFLEKNSNIF